MRSILLVKMASFFSRFGHTPRIKCNHWTFLSMGRLKTFTIKLWTTGCAVIQANDLPFITLQLLWTRPFYLLWHRGTSYQVLKRQAYGLIEEEKDDLEQTEDPRYSYRIERSTDQDAAQPGSVSGLRNWLDSDQTNDMRVSFEEAEVILEPPSAYVTITSASMPTGEAEDIPGTSSSHDTAPRPSMFSQKAEDIPGTSSAHDAILHPFTCSQEAEDIPEALFAHTTSRPSMYFQEAADNNPGTSSVHLTTPRRYLPFQEVGNTQETPNPSSSIAATANTPNETPSNNKILAACSSIHVSPEEIVPMPQVTRRKKVGVSRQGSSKILTATPEKARLEELAKKRKKQTNAKSRPA